jgi:hypothetical protein
MPVDPSFVRIAAEWPASYALAILGDSKVTRAIVHRLDPNGREYFYAYPIGVITRKLVARSDATVHEALDLHESTSSPTASDPAQADPGRDTVILVQGQLLGVASPGAAEVRAPDLLGPASTLLVRRGLTLSAPESVVVGVEADVFVDLVKEIAAGAAVLLAATTDTLEIVLEARAPLEVVGSAKRSLILGDEETGCKFVVRGTAEGNGALKVRVYRGGLLIGSVPASVRVVATIVKGGTQDIAAPLVASAPAPDLAIVIDERGPHEYSMVVSSKDPKVGLNLNQFGPIKLGDDAPAFFTGFFEEIEAIFKGPDPAAMADALEGKGTFLTTKLMPDALRETLWSLRKRIATILIQSDEPWVPWELCRLFHNNADGTIEEGDFLSREFVVTRWFKQTALRSTLTAASVGLVVPSNSGLAAASGEARFVRMLATATRTVTEIPARSKELRAALGSATHDVLHFTGHGEANEANADRANIRLETPIPFKPEDICGRVASFGARHPLVILNACQVGRAGRSLGGHAGWPQAFIKAGAGAFIAPFWSISDGKASVFAQAFYEALLGESQTIGEAVRAARDAVKNDIDPTWLAYVVYAYPDAKIV